MDDATLLRGLTARFERQPLLATAKLGISVEDGVAVLSGYTGEGATKAVAELTAMEMPEIRAVVNEIETTAEETWRYVDCRIAKKACDLLEWNALTPANLRIRVEHGRLSIFGCVAGDDHFRVISMILADFSGARSIDNHLKIAPHDEDEISSRLVTA